jgi:hypothetical protein
MPPFVSKLRRTYWEVIDLEKKKSNEDFDPYPRGEFSRSVGVNDANTISSLLEGEDNLHAPCIDVDWHSELRLPAGVQELDIWCKWPRKNKNENPKLTVDEIELHCDELRKFGFIEMIFFSGDFENIRYRFVISTDVAALLVPSKSQDHFHFYLETVLTWKQYMAFVYNLNQMGIVQTGFYGMTKIRGMSHLRKPSPELFVIET